ncbi:MAG: K+/H+ antiporter subunit F [Firmicutes bacterium]|nr:K+/H+ antiporter subunit F [Bacillota bacterium]
MLLPTVTNLALFTITISMALCLWRLIVGPSFPDRVAASDTISTNIVALLIVLSIKFTTQDYFDAVLVIAILGFLSSVALAKFLIGGSVFDRD